MVKEPSMSSFWARSFSTSEEDSSRIEEEDSSRIEEGDSTRIEDSETSDREIIPMSPSPAMPHAVRGYTAAGILEAEAAEEVSQSEVEVKVGDAPRCCNEVMGACTVVQVRAFDRPGLLASLSALLTGLHLTVARAVFSTSEQSGLACNEFWVQQPREDGLGPVLEGVKRRAIEQRVRQWSAGQRLELRPPQPRDEDANLGFELPGAEHVTVLPPHEHASSDAACSASTVLVGALAAALSIDGLTWLGTLPPVLARQTATALLPQMHRFRLAAGTTVERCGDDALLLLEEPLPVLCARASDGSVHEGSPAPLSCRTITHGVGAVLCLTSSVEEEARRLQWHSLSAPDGGAIAVVSRDALRELLGDVRKAAVRRHAKQLAGAAYFAPLGTPQLLALCHRAVEIEAEPSGCIPSLADPMDGGSALPMRQPSVAVVGATQATDAPPGTSAPIFMIVLRGEAVLMYTPPEGERVPVHRLRTNDHFGAINVLLGHAVCDGLELVAGEGGCTMLQWSSDEFLQRELSKLPELLGSSWASHSPLALITTMPRMLGLLRPTSPSQMGVHPLRASSAELCVVLRGSLNREAAITVTVEAIWKPEAVAAAGDGDDETDGGDTAPQRLLIRVELPTRGTKLKQIAGLLTELELDVTSGTVTRVGDVTKDQFSVRYRGPLTVDQLAATLRSRLLETLQARALLPGDSVVAARAALPVTSQAHAGDDAVEATDATTTADDTLIGLLDLRALAAMFATAANPDRELWLRYLQARAPDLLTSLGGNEQASVDSTTEPPNEPTADRWLAELRGFMLLFWRRRIGGSQLCDGVQMRDLLLGPMLGEGAYGQVFLARHRVLPDRWYAVKRQELGDLPLGNTNKARQQLRYLEREREVLLLLARESRGYVDRHLFVQLITHGQDAQTLQLAMTAVLGGELFHLLQETGAMAESEVVFYAACLTLALQHLHSRGIAYRDLKTENVLLSGGFTHAAAGWPVLADFGLANWVKHDGSNLQTFCGTPAFIAPEVATQNGYGTAADWWSLGVLIYQLLTLSTPFQGPNARATIENIIHGRRVQALSPSVQARVGELSEGATDIIDALLHPDPAERLGGPLRGNEVRVHPFFWGFDWSQIEKRQMTPPHAARCRERAIATTQHPSLLLPPLPFLPDAADAVDLAGAPRPPPLRPNPNPESMTTMQMDNMEGALWPDEAAVDTGDYV